MMLVRANVYLDVKQDVYMTKEEKAALEAEEVEAKAKAEADAKDDEPADDEAKAKSDEESKQYEADLQEEKDRTTKAEKAAADLAFKLREKKRIQPQEEEEVVEEEEKPLTRKELQAVLAEERQAHQKEARQSEANRIAGELSINETEKALILAKWNNRTFPSDLSLQEQIEECWASANRKKWMAEREELMRAAKGKQSVNSDASGTHHDAATSTQPKMAGTDASELARIGFKWNATNKRYEKKLPDGSTLVKDPKTKGTQRIKA